MTSRRINLLIIMGTPKTNQRSMLSAFAPVLLRVVSSLDFQLAGFLPCVDKGLSIIIWRIHYMSFA